jgi:hypothetical protein
VEAEAALMGGKERELEICSRHGEVQISWMSDRDMLAGRLRILPLLVLIHGLRWCLCRVLSSLGVRIWRTLFPTVLSAFLNPSCEVKLDIWSTLRVECVRWRENGTV